MPTTMTSVSAIPFWAGAFRSSGSRHADRASVDLARARRRPISAERGNRRILGACLEDRWRKIWSTYTDMRYLLERDIP